MTESMSQFQTWSPPRAVHGPASAPRRIAIVQHGDLREAMDLVDANEPEPYFGMTRSVAAIRALTRDSAHLAISLDAPAYRVAHGTGTLVGLPLPRYPARLPGTVPLLHRAWAIRRELAHFQPTHVLLRAAGMLGLSVLRWCVRHEVSTLVLLADYMRPRGWRQIRHTRRFMRLLNASCVYAVGNHRLPAQQSLVKWGLRPDKAVAYDFAPSRRPRDYSPKSLAGPPWRVVYAGNLLPGKGVGDLIDAMSLLVEQGLAVTATLAGTGPGLEVFQGQARKLPAGRIEFAGRLGNDQVFNLMRQAAVVCVPSRPDYPEGLPMTLTEGLASRTPLIVSDHPVMAGAFCDGEGMCFFPAGDPPVLARVIQSVLSDSQRYETLSRTTEAAYARVECPTLMPDLIARWRATFGP